MKIDPLVKKRPHRPGLTHYCSHAVPSFYPIAATFIEKYKTSLLISDWGGRGGEVVDSLVAILVDFDKQILLT